MPGSPMDLMLDTGGGGLSSSSSASLSSRASFDSSGWSVNSGGSLNPWVIAAVAAAALGALFLLRSRK